MAYHPFDFTVLVQEGVSESYPGITARGQPSAFVHSDLLFESFDVGSSLIIAEANSPSVGLVPTPLIGTLSVCVFRRCRRDMLVVFNLTDDSIVAIVSCVRIREETQVRTLGSCALSRGQCAKLPSGGLMN
ncbi:hypothetical protein JTE90_024413 [Oedothorax gibbosus]|uniref:dUTPase-like domain-containing protein n=1 Tax=Oedothorax gibbosus TaxID=931172 RepID=A0AAV6TDT2_9ARAC|nr:hypothetical protein JTE90_024413 [Oedothorax gibbosus]